jgi:hypothetical protein
MRDGQEVVLGGGSMTRVVRVADTVRRATGRWTPAVHALLAHLDRLASTVRRGCWASTSTAGSADVPAR